jgi:hypothetical protein
MIIWILPGCLHKHVADYKFDYILIMQTQTLALKSTPSIRMNKALILVSTLLFWTFIMQTQTKLPFQTFFLQLGRILFKMES